MTEALYPTHYPLLLTLARTGMRVGEAVGLRWEDIDFHGGFITVRRTVLRYEVSTPKNGQSRRVDMSPQLAANLKAHRTRSKKKGLKLGLGGLPEYVFTNKKGNHECQNNWRERVFYKALEKAELRRVRVHDIRHSYATIRISKGHNILDVSTQLGHKSPKITLDKYSHWLPGREKSEVAELDNDFGTDFACKTEETEPTMLVPCPDFFLKAILGLIKSGTYTFA